MKNITAMNVREAINNGTINANNEAEIDKWIYNQDEVKHELNDGMWLALIWLFFFAGIAGSTALFSGVGVPLYLGMVVFMLAKRLSNIYHKWLYITGFLTPIEYTSENLKTTLQKLVLFESTTNYIILRNVILFGTFFLAGVSMLTMIPVAGRTIAFYLIGAETMVGVLMFLSAQFITDEKNH